MEASVRAVKYGVIFIKKQISAFLETLLNVSLESLRFTSVMGMDFNSSLDSPHPNNEKRSLSETQITKDQ